MRIQGNQILPCTAEKGSIIFAVFNVIAVSVAGICCGLELITSGITQFLGIRSNDQDDVYLRNKYMFTHELLGLLLIGCFVAFIFAVILIHALIKKNAENVKVYFIYGVVMNVTLLVAAVGYIVMGVYLFGVNYNVLAGALLIIFTYTLILAMIRKTYRKFETMKFQFDHHQLLEAQKC